MFCDGRAKFNLKMTNGARIDSLKNIKGLANR